MARILNRGRLLMLVRLIMVVLRRALNLRGSEIEIISVVVCLIVLVAIVSTTVGVSFLAKIIIVTASMVPVRYR